MSSADRVRYSYVAEVVGGVTPNNPNFKALRITGESLKTMRETAVSAELDPSRVERDQIVIGESNTGSLNHELLWADHEDLLAAVLGGNWVVDGGDPKIKTVDNGVLLKHFSILKQFQDVADANHLFKGQVFNTWALTMQKKSILTGSFGVMGMAFDNGAIASLGIGVPVFAAAGSGDPYNGAHHIKGILINDVPMTSCIDNMSLNVANNIRPQECLGSAAPTGFTMGTFMVTGSKDIYFKTEDEFNMYRAGTAFKLNLQLENDEGQELQIELPRCKFEDMEIMAGGKNQDVLAKGKFRALQDPVTGRVMRITSIAP